MNSFLGMVAVYGVFGFGLLAYGIWGLRCAKRGTTERDVALGMHAASFGIPCGCMALAAGAVWVYMYASH